MSAGPRSQKSAAGLARRSTMNAVRKRELNLAFKELSNSDTFAFAGRNNSNITNVKRSESATVARSEVHIHLCNSSTSRGITVFLGTVVGSRAAVVSHPDAEVLHLVWLFLEDLVDSENFAVRFLQSFDTTQKVPKAAHSSSLVGGKQTHAEDLGVGVGIRRLCPANDLELRDRLGRHRERERRKKKK